MRIEIKPVSYGTMECRIYFFGKLAGMFIFKTDDIFCFKCTNDELKNTLKAAESE